MVEHGIELCFSVRRPHPGQVNHEHTVAVELIVERKRLRGYEAQRVLHQALCEKTHIP